MALVHAQASGMGGMRTAGDLVARVMFAKRMKREDAKRYVAEKLGISVLSLTDEIVMQELREQLGLGVTYRGYDATARGIEAKINISRVLDLKINSVENFLKRTGTKM